MRLPEIELAIRLHRKRTRSGYTTMRITYATRALLQKIESQFDEPLDSIVFYMAAKELGLNYAAILSVLDNCRPRLGSAQAAR